VSDSQVTTDEIRQRVAYAIEAVYARRAAAGISDRLSIRALWPMIRLELEDSGRQDVLDGLLREGGVRVARRVMRLRSRQQHKQQNQPPAAKGGK
jgi:hypothetical protein